MKNEEKFKTANERIKAFNEWRRTIKCEGCSQLCDTCEAGPLADECGFNWLSLEAEDEKPEPCPFCGATCNMVSIESKSMYFLKCYCGCGYRSGYKSLPRAAISEHNRVCRAVKIAKESEVK